jgi:hypothetical protein
MSSLRSLAAARQARTIGGPNQILKSQHMIPEQETRFESDLWEEAIADYLRRNAIGKTTVFHSPAMPSTPRQNKSVLTISVGSYQSSNTSAGSAETAPKRDDGG